MKLFSAAATTAGAGGTSDTTTGGTAQIARRSCHTSRQTQNNREGSVSESETAKRMEEMAVDLRCELGDEWTVDVSHLHPYRNEGYNTSGGYRASNYEDAFWVMAYRRGGDKMCCDSANGYGGTLDGAFNDIRDKLAKGLTKCVHIPA